MLKSVIKNWILMILLFICIIFIIVACSSKTLDTIPSTQVETPLLTIDEQVIDIDEIMLYLLEARLEFEQLGGEDIWESDGFSSGKNAEEVAKTGAIENIVKTKIVLTKADEIGITISTEEEEDVKQRAKEYYEQLDEELINAYGISMDTVYKVFRESLIRSKLISEVTKEFSPDEEKVNEMLQQDSDYITLKDKNPYDVLTQLDVKYLMVKIDDESADETKALADEIYNAVGSEDFETVVERYKEDNRVDSNLNATLALYQFPDENREEILQLQPGEISTIIELPKGYYVFLLNKISEPTNEEIKNYQDQFDKWESSKIDEITQYLKLEAFNEIYNEWKNSKTILIDETIWSNTSIHGIKKTKGM